MYVAVLAPILYHLWIFTGTANANFFYAITLVYALGQIILIVEVSRMMHGCRGGDGQQMVMDANRAWTVCANAGD